METSIQYTLKNGFIDTITVEGSRVKINEKLFVITENGETRRLKFVSKINDFKTNNKINIEISESVFQFINTHKSLKKPKYIGHIYNLGEDWVIIRTIHFRYSKEDRNFPYLFYNVWILKEKKEYKTFEAQFELEFHRIGSGNYHTGKKTLQYGYPRKTGKLNFFKTSISFRILAYFL